ncbi:MAG TPA: hydrogenase formation protein HypD [Dissulfurispiraceae bacterium]|nr:hydrogenase formation protein HypD [Dissulfurispiraceae bacterium]
MIDIVRNLHGRIGRPLNFMEVCGTHTVAIFRHGIRSLLPDGLKLLSGPGCPVCVTSIRDVDTAIAIACREDVILTTFGDMMRVPGGTKSLMEVKAEGADIRIVYSPLDSLKIARDNPSKKVVFFSAGFETTAPSAAATVSEAERVGIPNFYIYSVHKVVPPALEALLLSDDVRIDGFILPGHVSTIIGTKPYKFIPDRYSIPCAVTGFDANDIFGGIAMLLKQTLDRKALVEVEYKTVVKEEGNPKAVKFIEEIFEPADSYWRGIGVIQGSGLKLRKSWEHRDAEKVFDLAIPDASEPKGCMCGLVLRGIKMPSDCPLFAKACTPDKPVGACMVSSEGSCAAYYRYRDVLER